MQHLFWRLYVMFCTHSRSGGNLGAFLGSFLFQLSTATAFLILGLFCFGVGTFGVAINLAQRRISKQVQPQVTLIKPATTTYFHCCRLVENVASLFGRTIEVRPMI